MEWSFLIILFSHALVGWAVIAFTIYLLLSKVERLKKPLIAYIEQLGLNTLLVTKLEGLDLNPEIEPIIDERLDALIDQYRLQIPMLSMFLTGGLTDKLKSTAKLEILKALPAIKIRLMANIEQSCHLEQMVEEKLEGIQFNQLIRKSFKKEMFLMKVFAAFFGFCVGTIVLATLELL